MHNEPNIFVVLTDQQRWDTVGVYGSPIDATPNLDRMAEEYTNPWVPEDPQGRPGNWHEELPDYYGICQRIDENLGRLLNELGASGELDDTIVLFTSADRTGNPY